MQAEWCHLWGNIWDVNQFRLINVERNGIWQIIIHFLFFRVLGVLGQVVHCTRPLQTVESVIMSIIFQWSPISSAFNSACIPVHYLECTSFFLAPDSLTSINLSCLVIVTWFCSKERLDLYHQHFSHVHHISTLALTCITNILGISTKAVGKYLDYLRHREHVCMKRNTFTENWMMNKSPLVVMCMLNTSVSVLRWYSSPRYRTMSF